MDMTFLQGAPIAHRGLHDKSIPENSMAAFRAAIQKGFPIETDVRLSSDGELLLFHDNTLLRMTGARLGAIDCTAEELSRLRLNGTEERIPHLYDLLEETRGKVPLLIEIKNVPERDARAFLTALADALKGYRGAFAIQSFVPKYVKLFKELRPNVPCGILGCAHTTKADFGGSLFWKFKARVIRELSMNGRIKPDFISYAAADYPNRATEKFEGLKLAWTVRSPKEEARARQYADNIIFENYLPTV